ncbi:MAG: hypothetical protein NZ849_00675 [Meiothermus sp.]|nr:hypothetical protein [Meiothermus sp.]
MGWALLPADTFAQEVYGAPGFLALGRANLLPQHGEVLAFCQG